MERSSILKSLGRDVCLICRGSRGPLSARELEYKITQKGLSTLLKSCDERQDEVADIVQHIRGTSQMLKVRFHFQCRSTYTDTRKRSLALKRRQDENNPNPKESKITRVMSLFSWDEQCFICGKPENRKKGKILSNVNLKPKKVRQKVLDTARAINDQIVIQRLLFEEDIFAKKAKYHKLCYQTYTCKRNVNARTHTLKKEFTDSTIDSFVKTTFLHFKDAFDSGKVVLLCDMRKFYNECIVNSDASLKVQARSFFIKEKLLKLYGSCLSFYSQRGRPDVVCSSSLTVGCLMKSVQDLMESDIEHEAEEEVENEDHILHKAVSILRNDIEKIEPTIYYPSAHEINIDTSAAFLPKRLQRFIQCLCDKTAFNSSDIDHVSSEDVKRRYISLAECIVYCSRRGKSQVIPPFHIGLMTQLQHEYGSRNLIDTLNAYGMCASYDELRIFQTVAAEAQISRANDGVYVPPGIVNMQEGGSLIQEGDDNVDINVETIDGKNTYHSMARVIFQEQDPRHKQPLIHKLKRSTHKTLKCNDTTFLRTLPFEKPKVRPEPSRLPMGTNVVTQYVKKLLPFHCTKDIVWTLLRQVSRGVYHVPQSVHYSHDQVISSWTGFNSIVSSRNMESVSFIAYPPIIEAPPSDMSTVYTTLKRGKDLVEKCGQLCHVHTFDQQLYAIAQMVRLSHQHEFPNLIVRLGGFHTMATFIACIGKIWGDAGLRDILADSNVYAPASVEMMLSGKQFHRAIRGLTLVFEALIQQLIGNFLMWVEEHHTFKDLEETITHLCNVQEKFVTKKDMSPEIITDLTITVEQKLLPLLKEFVAWGRQASSTFAFWDNFLIAMQIVLSNIRAEREGDWKLHLSSIFSMLPYFFVADRPNYARWGTLYAVEMLHYLPESVSEAFHNGKFPVRQTSGKFKGTWTDMAVESTIIKDSKGDSGIIGLTRKESAVLRWTCIRHILGEYSRNMHLRSGLKMPDTTFHEQTKPAMMKRDEADAQQIISHIKNNMTDPFNTSSHPSLLVNIGTGLVATSDINDSLLKAVEKGEKMLDNFLKSRLIQNLEKNTSFYQPITRSGLKTLKIMMKTTNVKIKGKNKRIAVSPELIYQRALSLSKVRPDINLNTVLSYPVTSVPPALFKEDGSKRRTNKSDLLHVMEEIGKQSATTLPQTYVTSAVLIDGMAELQKMNVRNMTTFSDIANSCFGKITNLFHSYEEVHLIFDRYDDEFSPKDEERDRRRGSGNQYHYHVEENRALPKWKTFMGVSHNKGELTNFISSYVEEKAVQHPEVFKTKYHKLFIAGGYSSRLATKKIDFTGVSIIVEELSSTQTEADTRIMLHATHFNNRMTTLNCVGRLVVQSPDTDVLVLLTYYCHEMKAVQEIWFETGQVMKMLDLRRYIPVHLIASQIGEDICKEKLKNLQTLKCDNEVKTISSSTEFVTALYDPALKFKGTHKSLNKLRVRMASTRCTLVSKLPPCEASFLQHVKRASWQTKTWCNSHVPKPELPKPIGNDGLACSEVCRCESGENCNNPHNDKVVTED
ncbi:uncharacterized protein LOC117110927 [Anneissia japonica]|uniref:uncharacterized protein LOC117110927 n=1 Tax=Anneissia japonica TaxID=1529436 RepID=UPI0014255C54|nr:uncharacterized protein LOC117110927 [Anneissia japonica]